jgi:Dockerin type I domain
MRYANFIAILVIVVILLSSIGMADGQGLINTQGDPYDGTLKIYIVEPISRWIDYDGYNFHFGFLGFAFDAPISLAYQESFNQSIIWDAAQAGYDPIADSNIMVIAVLFNSEGNPAYSTPPDSFPFTAYYVDGAAAAIPGQEGTNEVDGDFTHVVFLEAALATWANPAPATSTALESIYSSNIYPFYYVSMVFDSNVVAYDRVFTDYNMYWHPSVFFDGGYRITIGGYSNPNFYTPSIEESGAREVPLLTMAVSLTWLGSNQIQIDIDVLNGNHITGDANGDGTINVSDAVYIINYVFVGGDPPDPLESGDVNCDGTVNVSDAVWIINYVFAGGNAPGDLDGDGIPDC